MNKHLTANYRLSLSLFLCAFFNTIAYSQSNGTSLRNDISVEHIIEFPKEGFRNEPIRLVKDEVTGNLLYNEYGGTIWEIDITSPTPAFNFRYSAFDHNLPIVQGMTMHDDILYLVGNEEVNNGDDNVGIITKGVRIDNNRREWTVIARTEPYLGKPETPFDHKMAGNAVSPDGQFIYVSTNSRTNHGEVAGLGREDELNILILKIPTNPSSPINLLNSKEWLRNNGYLYAEGIRNGFDMAFDNNGNLFEVENSGQRDDPEEMNWIREGRHYGFPYRLGGNDNPIIIPGYDSNNDPLVPDDQKGTPLFAYDPNFPAPPAGVTFSEPIRNLGPDADLFRDPITGAIRDASNEGSFITTFTAHRSPVGFGFDNANNMGGNFTGDAFMASFSGNTWPLIGGDSEDLLHIELNYNGALDNYDANVYKIATGFAQPIDIVVDENVVWLAEYGDGVNRGLWKITLPCGNPSVCGIVTPPPPPTYSCEEIMVIGGQEQIRVLGLPASNVAVEIYNSNNELIFSCNNNCSAIPSLNGLASGNYQVNVQVFDDNLELICERNNLPTVVTSIPICDDVSIIGGEGQINITSLTAPNEIVQVFDASYNIVFRCEGEGCGSEQLINNLSAGTYFVGVQFYDESFGLICALENIAINVTVTGGNNGCDAILDGDLDLFTQADVAAYAGYEVINGNLRIGNFESSIVFSDITSLAALQCLKEVKGDILINRTNLINLKGLDNLELIGTSLDIFFNQELQNLEGLEQLQRIEKNFKLNTSRSIQNLNELQGLTFIGEQIIIGVNDALTSISGLSSVTNTSINYISIYDNQSLKNLNGLENFTTFTKDGVDGNIYILKNSSLTNIEGLRNIIQVDDQLRLEDNPQLSDCCAIAHLLDDDFSNGKVDGLITIKDNASPCDSPQNISVDCGSPVLGCLGVEAIGGAGTLEITELTAPIEIVQVFDADFNLIFRCQGGDCGNEVFLTDLAAGQYTISIQFYTANWESICEEDRLSATVSDGATSNGDCEDLIIESGNEQINITGLTAPIEIVQVFDENYIPIFRCEGGDCGNEQFINDLSASDYFVSVQFYTANWAFICEQSNVKITVTEDVNPPPPSGSADCAALTFTPEAGQISVAGLNTAYSQVQIIGRNTDWQVVTICQGDCAETQIIPNLATGEYTVKVQLNASDETDCYREERVTIGDTPPPPPPPSNGNCDDLSVFVANAELFIQGLTAPIEIVQVFDENYQLVFRCQGADCGSEQIINSLAAGNYFVSVQFYTADWKFICAEENILVTIEDGNTGIFCDEAEKDGFTRIGNLFAKEFYVSNNSLPIEEAKQACNNANSRLASGLISEEIDFIKANINNEAFIDLSDSNQEGVFQWANGRTYDTPIFDNTEANDLVFIAAWNDELIATNNNVWKHFICEVPCAVSGSSSDSRNAAITQLENAIKLFPNPAQSILNLQVLPLMDKKGTIQIFNIYGQLVQQFDELHFNTTHQQLDIPNFENGLYLLTIQADNMPLISKRFVVEHWK